MSPTKWVYLLLLILVNLKPLIVAAGQRSPCRWCHNVSHIWHGVAYKCGFCPRVPNRLPMNLTWLHLLAFQSTNVHRYAFHAYKNLAYLRLSDNQIASIPIPTFKHLSYLRHMYLSGNNLEHFPHLPKSVRILHVQNNNITYIPFLHLPHLHDLVADHNGITHLDKQVFRYTPKLSLLSLGHNKIKRVDVSYVLYLEILSVEHNRLREFPRVPTGIVVLYLDGNEITDFPRLDLPSVEQIHIADNRIVYLDNMTFVNTPNLRVLDLAHNPLAAISKATVHQISTQLQIDLTPAVKVVKTPVLKIADSVPTGYMWIVAVVSTFAFSSAVLTALVVIILTKTRCGPKDEAFLEETSVSNAAFKPNAEDVNGIEDNNPNQN